MTQKLQLGIDDAGRGPVLGPMVLGGVLLKQEDAEKLKKLGVKDSKMLSPMQREKLFKEITKTAIAYKALKISAEEIDARESNGLNLNQLEAIKMAELINSITEGRKEEIEIFLDCPSVNIEAWSIYFIKHIDNQEGKRFRIEHKADFKYPACSAASIVAKVTRDREIEKIKKEIGYDFGSLPFAEEVLIESDGKIFLEKIGHLVQDPPKNIKVFSLDRKDHSIKKYPVTGFVEHPRTKIYRLDLDFGKNVRLSKNHPVFCLNEKLEIIPKMVGELEIGEKIAVCGNMSNDANLKFLDLVELLKNVSTKGSSLYAKVSKNFIEKNKKAIIALLNEKDYNRTAYYGWLKNEHLPLDIFSKLNSNIDVNISSREDKVKFSRYFKVDRDFMWFLGIFIAEGWLSAYNTYISNQDELVIDKIKKIGNKLGISYFHNRSKGDIGLSSILLVKILKCLVKGNNAYTKEVPNFVFSTHKQMITEFLEGLYYGDGYLNASNKWEIELRSEKVIKQIQWLNLFLGNFSTNRRRRNKPAFITNTISSASNSLCPYNLPSIAGVYLRELRQKRGISSSELSAKINIDKTVISRIEKRKSSSIQRETIERILKVLPDKKLDKLLKSNLCWLRVKKITCVGSEKVYDLGVAFKNIENFLGGQTGIILHNSGYPADPATIEFLKKHGSKFENKGIIRKTWDTWISLKKKNSQKRLF